METTTTIRTVAATSVAGRKEWIGLAVLALPTLLASMDATVTYLALPSISSSLKPGSSQLLWITDIFTFMEGGFLIVMGTLGDRIGQRRLLLTGAIAFALASSLAASAKSPGILIGARASLGVAGAVLLPCTLALIRNMFHNDKQRTIAFGIYTTCYSGGTALGPVLGGVLLSHFWWGSVFLISVPVLILFLFASKWLPEFRDKEERSFDLPGAVLLVTSSLFIVYGVKKIAEHGVVDWISLAIIVTGIIFGAGFLLRQKIIKHPLIDLNLFRIPAFGATLAVLFFSLFCWSGLYLFFAQYLQLVLGLDPLKAGVYTLFPAALSMAGCMLAPQILRWIRRISVIVFGMVIMTAGMLMMTQLAVSSGAFAIVLAAMLLTLGCGLVVTLGIDLVVSTAPREQAGSASGISETSTTFGTAFGIALLGSIGMAVYRDKLLIPSLSDPAIPIKEAKNTLGEALLVSKQLPGKMGVELMDHARTAFVRSLNISALVAALLMVVVAVFFSLILYRRSR